ncbi:hypothetical protein A9404_02110 [Halothiobacillus diazotrophicus]|uniref:Host attachment protein n=1 Tax=Halothiobacillus diazotrophicus TaxID=1860122 RepID=A0A191ZEP1_9GAMM|nr:host attachment protein [Halothiobacillus diazotrophicus]ANJ66332.1 hypothetical protein A9404_02110 [Halothiobacillus diazotrophicus]
MIVADAARARIFRIERQPEIDRSVVQKPMHPGMREVLVELEEFWHPVARQHASEFASDAPGFSSVAGMQSKFGMDEKTSPKEQEEIRFAHQLNQVLLAHVGNYDELYLVAPPHFLGLLRDQLDEQVQQKVTQQIDKDLSRLDKEEIQAHLLKSNE